MDKITAERRSANMRAIRGKDTAPEIMVRRLLFNLDYRFRVHQKDLPGKPDLVFSKRRKAIFIHGCFWHQHPGCREGRLPKSNHEYWVPKLEKNKERDLANIQALNAGGWTVMVVWECEVKDEKALLAKLIQFLGPAKYEKKSDNSTN